MVAAKALIDTIQVLPWFDDRFYRVALADTDIRYLPSITTVLNASPKHHLAHWRGSVGNAEADRIMLLASERGTRIHHACQAVLNGGMAIHNPRYQPVYTDTQIKAMQKEYGSKLHIFDNQDDYYHVYKFVLWLREVNPICLGTELIVYDLDKGVAGSLDYLFFIKSGEYNISGAKPIWLREGFYVADLKTGKAVGDDAVLQVSKYSEALTGLLNEEVYSFKGTEYDEMLSVDGGLVIHTNASTRTGIPGLSTKVIGQKEIGESCAYFDNHLLEVWKRTNTMKPRVFDLPTALDWKTL